MRYSSLRVCGVSALCGIAVPESVVFMSCELLQSPSRGVSFCALPQSPACGVIVLRWGGPQPVVLRLVHYCSLQFAMPVSYALLWSLGL